MSLRAAIENRYTQTGKRVPALRERLISISQEYLDSGYGDANAEQRLCSNDTHTYWQQLSEVLLAHQLIVVDLGITHQTTGPDFCIEFEGRRVWIEVITPTPVNIPAAWLAPTSNGVRDFPHEEILLRWTAAIKQKVEVLLGNDRDLPGYLPSGIVAPGDCYVIAINGRLLRDHDGVIDALTGISQFPFAVEATLAVGPLQVRINRQTLEASPPDHQQRYFIHKPKGQPVPAYTFLDARYTPVSAVWATDIDEFSLLGYSAKMVVVHNPLAVNPIPSGLLPALEEYVAVALDEENYRLDRIKGRTVSRPMTAADQLER